MEGATLDVRVEGASVVVLTGLSEASPGLPGGCSSGDGRATAVGAHGVKGSGSPFHLSISQMTMAIEGALMGATPFSSHQRL